jgi:hypothetical protein
MRMAISGNSRPVFKYMTKLPDFTEKRWFGPARSGS